MNPTELGIYIGVSLNWNGNEWLCISFDKRGNWRSLSRHQTKLSAQRERQRLRRWHRNLAKQRSKR